MSTAAPTTVPPTTAAPADIRVSQNLAQVEWQEPGNIKVFQAIAQVEWAEPAATTAAPTTVAPTTLAPTTLAPTTLASTTIAPTTSVPTTLIPTTLAPTTLAPTTPAPDGTICWGHDTGVIETNIKDFFGNWAGTAAIQGVGDAERIEFDSGEDSESETWNIGPGRVKITIDKYGSGSGTPVIKYKSGNSQISCEADSWHAYTGSFITTGWIKIKIECA